jgi:DNA-directed RNA polymerase subunit RPC12/RpoP
MPDASDDSTSPFVPHPATGAPSEVAFYDCGNCQEEIHLNGPAGIHQLECGYCGAVNLVTVGQISPPLAPKTKQDAVSEPQGVAPVGEIIGG